MFTWLRTRTRNIPPFSSPLKCFVMVDFSCNVTSGAMFSFQTIIFCRYYRANRKHTTDCFTQQLTDTSAFYASRSFRSTLESTMGSQVDISINVETNLTGHIFLGHYLLREKLYWSMILEFSDHFSIGAASTHDFGCSAKNVVSTWWKSEHTLKKRSGNG
jgi:hypothetical protein